MTRTRSLYPDVINDAHTHFSHATKNTHNVTHANSLTALTTVDKR